LFVSFRWSVIISKLWRREVARVGKKVSTVVVFWKNDPLRGNFRNSVPKGFTTSPIYVLCCVQFSWNLADRKSVVMGYLADKKTQFLLALSLSRSRYCAWIAPKICQEQRQTMCSECSRSVHFRRSYNRTREHR